MTEIPTCNLNYKAVKCYVVDGEPWSKGNGVASILDDKKYITGTACESF